MLYPRLTQQFPSQIPTICHRFSSQPSSHSLIALIYVSPSLSRMGVSQVAGNHATYFTSISYSLLSLPPKEIHTDESLCQVPERSVLLLRGSGGAQPPLQLFRPGDVGPPVSAQVPRQRGSQGPRLTPVVPVPSPGPEWVHHRLS